MIDKFTIVCIAILFSIKCSAQPQRKPFMELGEHKFRFTTGVNFQFFDNPFFKFQTNKYSNVTFRTNSPKNFGLEYIFPNEVLKKNNIITGIYYSEADMAYLDPFSAGFSGSLSIEWRFINISVGLGLSRELSLGKRWKANFIVMPTITRYFVQKGQIDTSIDNDFARMISQHAPSGLQDDLIPIRYPSEYTRWAFVLKNKMALSYYITKRVSLSLNLVYNIGLPNKVFKYHFYFYDPKDLQNPVSYEQAYFSSGSAQVNLGLGINL